MKTNKIIITALISLFLTSCFSDKGNYEYTKLEQVNVDFTASKYVVTMGDEVDIIPALKYSSFPKVPVSEVEYEWKLNNEVVSTADKYTYKAGEKLETIIGQLKIKVVQTGEQYSGYFRISIESAYERGYLILYEDETGKNELGFVRSITLDRGELGDTIMYTNEYANIYEQANDVPMLKNAVSITEHSLSNNNSSGLATEITLVTENGNFMEDLNGESFKRETKIQDEFVKNELPDNFIPKQVVHTCWDSYLLDKDGLMYSRRSGDSEAFHTGSYNKDFTYNNSVKYSDVLFTLYSRTDALLALEYDAQGKRNYVGIQCEIYSNKKNGIRLPAIANDENKQLLKDITDVKGTIVTSDYIFEEDNGVLSQAVLMERDNKFYLHIMSYDVNSKQNISITKSEIVDLSALSGGKQVMGIATSKIKPHVYFWDDTNVYVYNTEIGEEKVLYNSPSRKIVAFAALANIKSYEYYGLKAVDSSFGIGFDTGEFEVYEFLRPELIGVANEGKPIFKAKNNFGKIKQIIHKYGTSGNFFEGVI